MNVLVYILAILSARRKVNLWEEGKGFKVTLERLFSSFNASNLSRALSSRFSSLNNNFASMTRSMTMRGALVPPAPKTRNSDNSERNTITSTLSLTRLESVEEEKTPSNTNYNSSSVSEEIVLPSKETTIPKIIRTHADDKTYEKLLLEEEEENAIITP